MCAQTNSEGNIVAWNTKRTKTLMKPKSAFGGMNTRNMTYQSVKIFANQHKNIVGPSKDTA